MTTERHDESSAPRQTPQAEPEAVMRTIASAMPWVISLFFHAGVLVILAFITIVLLKPPTPIRATPPPYTHLSEKLQTPKLVTKKPKLKDLDKVNPSDWTDRNKAIPMPRLGKIEKISIRGLTGPPIGVIKGMPDGKRGIFIPTIIGPPGGRKRGRKPEDKSAGNARHIVYVVDCSGSMMETFNEVRREMTEAIYRLGLRPDGTFEQSKQSMQTFHIIFFSTGKLRENPPHRLIYATETNKRAAVKYLKTITPEKQTAPIPALKRAFAVLKAAPGAKSGKLIFLLTDGEFPDSRKVFSVINTLNANRNVHINTILHRHHSPDAAKVLRRIAKENAGTFTFAGAGE